METPEQIGQRIVELYDNASESVLANIHNSPEPFRRMTQEFKITSDEENEGIVVDGTDEYHAIIDVVEDILHKRYLEGK